MTEELFKKLISINSVYPDEHAIATFLVSHLRKLGLTVVTQPISPGRFNIFASRGHTAKLLFYGHLDTAPTHTLSGWHTNPFTPQVSARRIYGLGAYDMKGGIAAFLTAIAACSHPVKVLLAVDEENYSAGAWAAVTRRPSFFKDLSLIVSAEPNFGHGDNSLTTGRTGRFVFQVQFVGQSAHLTLQNRGVDAVRLASRFLTEFYANRGQFFRSPQTIAQVRRIAGEAVGMSVPELCQIDVEVLAGPEDTAPAILRTLKKVSQGSVCLKPRPTPYLPGYHFARIPYSGQIAKIIHAHTRRSVEVINRSSVADDNVLATLKIPVVTWGPSGGHAHAANEYVDRISLKTFIHMYTDLLNLVR